MSTIIYKLYLLLQVAKALLPNFSRGASIIYSLLVLD